MAKQYHQLSEATLDKVAKITKDEIDATLHKFRGEDWSDQTIGTIDADITFPYLMSAFEKVTGEKNGKILEDWCWKFMDEDIYRAEDMDDFIEQKLKEYHITTYDVDDTMYGHKTTPKRKHRACGMPRVNIRNMF